MARRLERSLPIWWLAGRGQRPVARLAATCVRLLTGVRLPPEAVSAAFRLFGLYSSAAQLGLLWRMVVAPNPALRRLRRRAVRAVADYRAILEEAPHLRGVMKLDFTILLGLYRDALGISRSLALARGLVETYCYLAALVDAYDDLLDTAEARLRPLRPAEFRGGETGRLRERLVAHLEAAATRQPGATGLVRDLAAFEAQALAAHRQFDLASGLAASLDAVVQARAATSGLLLRFAAHLWSTLLALPANLAASSEEAAATFGLVAQFADDVIDWSSDDGAAQNLLGAALASFPEELAAARAAAARHPDWSLPVAQLRRLAPRSLAALAAARARTACYPPEPRFDGLRQFADDVYDALLPALPAINFAEFNQVRQETQRALEDM